jgi:hypothetical protein
MAKGELSSSDFQDFLETTLRHAANCSFDGAIHFVCMDWRHAPELLAAAGAVYAKTLNLCVWNKTNAGMGSLYRSQHELIFVFKHGKARHINNVNLGRHGRNRTNVWTYVSQNALSGTSKGKLALHPTIKPVAMIADDAPTGSPNLARRDDGRAAKRARSSHRSSRRGSRPQSTH